MIFFSWKRCERGILIIFELFRFLRVVSELHPSLEHSPQNALNGARYIRFMRYSEWFRDSFFISLFICLPSNNAAGIGKWFPSAFR
jgi:hypothetical protein